MTENKISYSIRGAIFEIYNALGPGLLESVYSHMLAYELSENGLFVEREVPVSVNYRDQQLDLGFRIDLLVEGKVLIELKSIDALHEVHHKQVLTYLKLTGYKLGLLVNFNTDDIAGSIIRKVNGL